MLKISYLLLSRFLAFKLCNYHHPFAAMDSGSLQSSSGGEEEYDSRGETITTFLNPSNHLGLVSPSSQGQFLSHSSLFDHNFQQSLATPLNSQYNNNNALVWPLGLRSEPNYSSQPLLHHQPLAANTNQPLVETTNVVGRSAHSLPSDQPKNPKKRTRASRRAPTTVLTTDTTNFRQMVQEFTGIPAGPFSGGGGGGSLYSRRLDLFSTAGSSMRTAAHSDPLGALRPSPHKPQMPSFIPSSSNTNFQLSTQIHHMEDQILTFQPLLQSSSLPLSLNNEPVFGSKSQAMDGLGISHEQASASVSGFLGNSDQARNCSTSHDKGLENVVCSAGDGDAASSWTCPN